MKPSIPPHMKPKIAERIQNKVDIAPNGCWIWTGGLTTTGRPKLGYRLNQHPMRYYVNRLSAWVWLDFDLESPLQINHGICNDILCVNPDHLYIGTHQDNMKDRKDRKKTALGSKCGRSRLNQDQVILIRKLARQGKNRADLAEQFDVSKVTIGHVVTRKTWRHI